MKTIKKILEAISTIPNDKLLHFFYGTLLAMLVSYFVPIGLPGYYIVVITLTVAILKEVYDKFWGSEVFDLKDIAYTIAPSIMIYTLLLVT